MPNLVCPRLLERRATNSRSADTSQHTQVINRLAWTVAVLASAALSCAPAVSGTGGSTGGVGAGTPGTGGTPAGTGGSAPGTSGSGSGGDVQVDAGSGQGGTGGRAASGGSGGANNNDAGAGGSGGGTATGGAMAPGRDGGGTDAAGGGPPPSSATCPPSALICEDFESGNLNAWTKSLSGGTLTVDSAHVTSGNNALSINVPANQHGGFLQRKGAPLFPLVNKTMWGRVMMYFDSVSDGHTDFVRGATASGGTPLYNVGEQHGAIMLNYYNGSAADCWARPSPGKTVPLKAWMCWEWSFDGNTNEMQFFIDGQLSRKVSGTGDGCLSGQKTTWTAPDFGTLAIGQYIAELRPTVAQMWLDDIAVGTAGRIGCPAAAP